jgi:hypothetical protein
MTPAVLRESSDEHADADAEVDADLVAAEEEVALLPLVGECRSCRRRW